MKEDILIILADWEYRSVEGFNRAIEKTYYKKVYSFFYKDDLHPEATDANISLIKESAAKKNIQVFDVELSNEHSISNWITVSEFIDGLDKETVKVTIDISTMPREVIWFLLYNFRRSEYSEIQYIYNKPENYDSTWLSKEADTPRLLFKHSGVIDLEKPTSLFIIPGFDQERVRQLITFFEPRSLTIALQKGNQFDNDIRNTKEHYLFEHPKQFIEIDGYSSDNGYEELKTSIKLLLKTYNVVIASLGPKLTALSLYKLNIEFPEIALAYVPCKQFNLNYSSGLGDTIKGIFKF